MCPDRDLAGTGLRRAAFLDRDGVINIDHGYVSDWENFDLYPGVVDTMRALQEAGYCLVIVTNQSGIGRGYYSEETFWQLMQRLSDFLSQQGVTVSGVYFCPHHPTNALPQYRKACDCRKPAPGMLLAAAKDLRIDLAQSLFVGDKRSDMEAGEQAGVGQLFFVNDEGKSHPGAITVSTLASVPTLLRNEEA